MAAYSSIKSPIPSSASTRSGIAAPRRTDDHSVAGPDKQAPERNCKDRGQAEPDGSNETVPGPRAHDPPAHGKAKKRVDRGSRSVAPLPSSGIRSFASRETYHASAANRMAPMSFAAVGMGSGGPSDRNLRHVAVSALKPAGARCQVEIPHPPELLIKPQRLDIVPSGIEDLVPAAERLAVAVRELEAPARFQARRGSHDPEAP